MSNYDAILILGGGVHECGKLPLWVEARLQRALDLEQGEPIITLSVGTTHKPPPLDEHGFPIFESVAAASYLADHGIAPERILVEATSYDTIGNAYFSRVIHVDPAGFRRLLIITSAFHMPRTEAVFRWVYGLDAPAGGVRAPFRSDARRGCFSRGPGGAAGEGAGQPGAAPAGDGANHDAAGAAPLVVWRARGLCRGCGA